MKSERLARQSFLGESSESRLAELKVGVVGLGGGGSHIVQQLAHAGVGNWVLFDPDHVEESNLNRLVGATRDDAIQARAKVDVAKRMVGGLLDKSDVQGFQVPWQVDAAALRGCDVIVGCLDKYGSRLELEAMARRYLIPYVDLGMDVHAFGQQFIVSGQVALSIPGRACLRCMGVITPAALENEAADYGAAGGRPQVVWSNGMLASAAVGMIVAMFFPWSTTQASVLIEYDGNSQEMRASTTQAYLRSVTCPHFKSEEVGDPWLS